MSCVIRGENMTPELQKILAGLCRHPCWNVHHGHGSFITFEFGKPHLKVIKFSEQARKRALLSGNALLTFVVIGIFGFTVALGFIEKAEQ